MTVQALLLLAGNANWTFVAASAVGTGVNPVAAIPAGVITGDLLVIAGASANSFSSVPGWVERLTSGNNAKLGVWTKIYAGDSDVTLTNTHASSVVRMLAYRNIPSSYLDVNGTVAVASATTIATNSLTTTVQNDLVVSFYGAKRDSSTASTWTAPANTNVRTTDNSTTTLSGLLIVDENKTAAGATTARTATVSTSMLMDSFAISFKQM